MAEVLRMELICLGSSEKNFLIIFLYSPLNSSFMQSFDYQRNADFYSGSTGRKYNSSTELRDSVV